LPDVQAASACAVCSSWLNSGCPRPNGYLEFFPGEEFLFCLCRWHYRAEEEALHLGAAERLKNIALRNSLNAFGRRRHAAFGCDCDDRLYDAG